MIACSYCGSFYHLILLSSFLLALEVSVESFAGALYFVQLMNWLMPAPVPGHMLTYILLISISEYKDPQFLKPHSRTAVQVEKVQIHKV